MVDHGNRRCPLQCPDRTPDESGRLRALAEYQIDPSQGLPSLTPIVEMAARLFDCPAAAVNLIGDRHVSLVASQGIGACDLSRDVSFCAHAINHDGIMVVEDAALDPRFHDNPLVTQGLIRFYAGVALRAPSGHALGALCVVDGEPRTGFVAQDRARLVQLAGMVCDKLELRRMEVASAARRFTSSAMPSPSAILSCDATARLTGCNTAAAEMFGWSIQDMTGAPIDMLVAEADRRQVRESIARVLDGAPPTTQDTVLMAQRHDGGHFPVELHWSHWLEDDKPQLGIILRDLSARQSERDALYQLANFDPVTQLPNRNLLLRHIGESMGVGQGASLVVVTLDGFTDLNNTLGRALGDRVLRQIGGRLRAAVPQASLIARMSGVKFAAVLPMRDPVLMHQAARAIHDALAVALLVDGHDIRLGSFCGLATGPDVPMPTASGPDAVLGPEELLGNAELALQQAMAGGRGAIALFVPQMRAQAVARRMLETELHHAFELGQFQLFFQPQVALEDGAITGAEALIRWHHPAHGLLLPAAFMPTLESSMLADAVGGWVMDRACAQVALWRRIHPDFSMSVNLSLAQLRHGRLPAIVAGVLAEHGLPPEALELEITENIILEQQDDILAQLVQIRESGVRLSFDDFGTGFASLNLLRDFPVSLIKIDKGFTQSMATSPADRAIVKGVIQMARDLGLQVIAEGVETAEAALFLQALGCHKGQGFHFGRPCTPGQFADRYLKPAGRFAKG
jgi:PAS domain S-box-containing protein/diguanylate cyclase (GGDEF)-like protein